MLSTVCSVNFRLPIDRQARFDQKDDLIVKINFLNLVYYFAYVK